VPGVLAQVKAGKLRAIGVAIPERSPYLPGVPTVAEQGYPGFEAASWFALLAPAGTPQAILDKVREASLKVLDDKEVMQKLQALGLDPVGSTGAETKAQIEMDIPKWAQVIKDAGIPRN
jgi:tripartite-type tricarboxylate transporter receptor subunit TctC